MIEQKVLSPPLSVVELPTIELPTEDGIPLESPWHRDEINLLIESIRYVWRDRTDFYTGGNMFIYFSFEQVRRQDYRGPDFFIIKDVDGTRKRGAWVVWEEEGRYPDLIIELLSPSTAETDRLVKKNLYERTFHTPEYYCYDPVSQELLGWHLQRDRYEALTPDPNGRLWSEVLQLWLGRWEGEFQGERAVWLRFFDADGNVVLTWAEAAAARAESERARAEVAEAEIAHLRAELARLKG
jgi:Uma2 family endonuclease